MMSCFTRDTCDNAARRTTSKKTIVAADQRYLVSCFARDGCNTSTKVSNTAAAVTGKATSANGCMVIFLAIVLGAAWLAFVMKKLWRRTAHKEAAKRAESEHPAAVLPDDKHKAACEVVVPEAAANAMAKKMGGAVWKWLVEIESERYGCAEVTDSGTGVQEKEMGATTFTLEQGSWSTESPLVDGTSLQLLLARIRSVEATPVSGRGAVALEGVALAAGMFAARHGLPPVCGPITLTFVVAVMCGAGLGVDGGPSALQTEPFQRLLGDFAMYRDKKTHPFRNTAIFKIPVKQKQKTKWEAWHEKKGVAMRKKTLKRLGLPNETSGEEVKTSDKSISSKTKTTKKVSKKKKNGKRRKRSLELRCPVLVLPLLVVLLVPLFVVFLKSLEDEHDDLPDLGDYTLEERNSASRTQVQKLEFLISLSPAEMDEIQQEHQYPEWGPFFRGKRARQAEQQRCLLRNAYQGTTRLTEGEVELRVKKEAAISMLMGAEPPAVSWGWPVARTGALPSEGRGRCRFSWARMGASPTSVLRKRNLFWTSAVRYAEKTGA